MYPIKVCDKELEDHGDLLFLRNKDGGTHYCFITDLAKLVSKQVSTTKIRQHICKRCLTAYGRNGERLLAQHKEI